MRRYTKKELNGYVSAGLAHDITYLNFKDTCDFIKNHKYEKIGYSAGSYGINGALLQDIDTGDFYAITGRTNALYQIM